MQREFSRERPEHTIQTTALGNEAYLWLVNVRQVQWKAQATFWDMGARIMRPTDSLLELFCTSHAYNNGRV
jgi:hypothetical protein